MFWVHERANDNMRLVDEGEDDGFALLDFNVIMFPSPCHVYKVDWDCGDLRFNLRG